MRPIRCQICGETYIGRDIPDRCPYCGVDGGYMVEAAEYVDYDDMDVCEKSEKFLRRGIELEMSNVAYYECAADNAQSEVARVLFKRIGKHEGEHLELFCDTLGIEEPEIEPEDCSGEDREHMANGKDREDRATKLYMQFAKEAPEPRIKQIFSAIAGIEQEHYRLFNSYG